MGATEDAASRCRARPSGTRLHFESSSEQAFGRFRRLTVKDMRSLVAIGLSVLAFSPAATATGRLSGATQISFGCPGPVREGEPGCNPWRPFVHARLTVAGNGIKRVVLS